jgi:hypothetical protein
MQSEEYYSRAGPLLTQGAVKEKSLVWSSEDRSSGLWLTVIQDSWRAC